MKNNKLFSLLLALLVCFSLVLTVSANSDNQNFTIAVEANPSTVVYGNTIKVSVMIKENPGTFGVNFDIKWDPAVLELVSVDTTAAEFEKVEANHQSKFNRVVVTVGDPMLGLQYPSLATKVTNTGKVLDLTFKVCGADADAVTDIYFERQSYVNLSATSVSADGMTATPLEVHVVSTNHQHTAGAEPTCTTNQICTHCYAELKPALGHDIVIDKAVAATCTKTGLTEGKHCTRCDDETVAQKVVDALGHTEVIDAKVDATCTKTGLTEGKHCSVCNEILVAQVVIPLADHTEVVDAKVDATCTKTGLTEGKHCSVCNEILVAQEEIPMVPHTEVIDAKVDATCTKTGLTEGKHCSVCGEVLVAQEEIPMVAHKEVTLPRVEPTYSSNGLTEGKKCSVCGTVTVKQQTIAALKHTVEVIPGKDATCTETGLTEGSKCTKCGEVIVEQEEIAALGHTEEKVDGKAPTCTATGLTDGTKCSVCGEVVTAQEEIAATGHKYDNDCDASCNNCSETREVPDHTYGDWETTKEAEVGVDGEQKRVCTECGHEDVQTIPALEPEFNFVWIIVGVAALAAIIILIVVLGKKKKQAAEA